MKIPLTDVVVDPNRLREDMGDIEGLAASIQRHGQLVPIIVNKVTMKLIAGERRYLAHRLLGLPEIKVVFQQDLNPMQELEIELAENLQRKDMSWVEKVRGLAEIVRVKEELYGKRDSARKSKFSADEGLSQADIAKSLGMSPAALSQDLEIASALETFPELAEEDFKTTAFKKYRRSMEAAISRELLKRDLDGAAYTLKCGNAKELIGDVRSDSVHLVLFDPPYGIDMEDAGAQSRSGSTTDYTFQDTIEYSRDLCSTLIPEFHRVMTNPGGMFCFFPIQHYQWFYDELCKVFTKDGVYKIPLIWNKTRGGTPWTGYNFSGAYESILFVRKGKLLLQKDCSDVFSYTRPATQHRIHMAERPVPLYKELIEIATSEGQTILDPTFGSGASIEAAIRTKRVPIGFELSEVAFSKALTRIEKVETDLLEEAALAMMAEEEESNE